MNEKIRECVKEHLTTIRKEVIKEILASLGILLFIGVCYFPVVQKELTKTDIQRKLYYAYGLPIAIAVLVIYLVSILKVYFFALLDIVLAKEQTCKHVISIEDSIKSLYPDARLVVFRKNGVIVKKKFFLIKSVMDGYDQKKTEMNRKQNEYQIFYLKYSKLVIRIL